MNQHSRPRKHNLSFLILSSSLQRHSEEADSKLKTAIFTAKIYCATRNKVKIAVLLSAYTHENIFHPLTSKSTPLDWFIFSSKIIVRECLKGV